MIGETIAHYRIVKKIASGGMGDVFLAEDTQLDRHIALKTPSIYYSVIAGPPEDHDLWKVSLATGKPSRLTKLAGPRGRLGYVFSTDDRYVYFTWYEDDGDIWVMDVMNPPAR